MSNGETLKRFDVKDGLSLNLIQEVGIEIVLVSGGDSHSTQIRANQLGIRYYFFNVKNKYQRIKEFQKERKISITEKQIHSPAMLTPNAKSKKKRCSLHY